MTCPYCDSTTIKSAKQHNNQVALILVLVGLCLSPWLIGVPMLIAGIVMSAKRVSASRYMCKTCQREFDWKPSAANV